MHQNGSDGYFFTFLVIVGIKIRRPRPWQGGARQGREVVKQLTINNEQPTAAAAAAANFWSRN